MSVAFYNNFTETSYSSNGYRYVSRDLDLNIFLAPRSHSTFFVKVKNFNFPEFGITSGSILVVDRSLDPKPGQVVLVVADNEFCIQVLNKNLTGFEVDNRTRRIKFNSGEDSSIEILGVVTSSINRLIEV